MRKIYFCLTWVAMTLALTACSNNQKSPGPAKEKKAAVEAPAGQTKPAAKEAAAAAVPTALKGKVAETMDASGYTYVRLDVGSGKEMWAAIPKTALKVGEEVSLQPGSEMNNFTSKSLNKTFDKIVFSPGLSKGEEKAAVGASGATGTFEAAVKKEGVKTSGGSAANVVPFSALKITKAAGPNGHAVGELFAKATALDKQKVVVKGQVVKISKNIMGKNWIHIQDGTGDPKNNTHDLVVTTKDSAEKGDIVTVEGVAVANKDFGSGYKYDVLVEDAKVKNVHDN
jgi:molybdopterin-binding protein